MPQNQQPAFQKAHFATICFVWQKYKNRITFNHLQSLSLKLLSFRPADKGYFDLWQKKS